MHLKKFPISICLKGKADLDKMVKLDVITSVDEPMAWVSSVAYAWKESGELCICLDPWDCNNAICRNHCCTPTGDEIAHEFAYSRYFTKLDARHGYWQLSLIPNSACSPPLTLHMVNIISYISPLD